MMLLIGKHIAETVDVEPELPRHSTRNRKYDQGAANHTFQLEDLTLVPKNTLRRPWSHSVGIEPLSNSFSVYSLCGILVSSFEFSIVPY